MAQATTPAAYTPEPAPLTARPHSSNEVVRDLVEGVSQAYEQGDTTAVLRRLRMLQDICSDRPAYTTRLTVVRDDPDTEALDRKLRRRARIIDTFGTACVVVSVASTVAAFVMGG